MDVALAFQRGADPADAAVHHVAGRDHVGAGGGVRQRLLDQGFDGFVVHDVTAVVDQPVLAVGGVRVERDVGDHAQVREALLERAHRALAQAVVLPRGFGGQRFGVRRGDREQRQRRHPQFAGAFGHAQQFVDRQALDAGHRADRGAAVEFVDEDRVDQVVRGEDGLAHQAAGEVVAAHPPR